MSIDSSLNLLGIVHRSDSANDTDDTKTYRQYYNHIVQYNNDYFEIINTLIYIIVMIILHFFSNTDFYFYQQVIPTLYNLLKI